KIRAKLPELIAARSASERGVLAFAHAIMTTDTRPKLASVRFRTASKEVTVLLLASGASGARVRDVRTRKKLSAALTAVCQSLAEQIVSDGEGVQHVIRLFVEQARSREEASLVARTIAHSMLVKTAWAGADPNWGRILAAVGRCGVPIDPS